ncbi:hypothetical protein NBRC116592_03730 [Colwellia sp. KU-HH00111]|uniref:hypothetical protein n=1 Tax=Colwellia sp. KU-HH00111 TaxID=3127652 RepID=UPI0031033B27
MRLSKTISTVLLSLASTSLLFSALPASAKNKSPWGFVSCSGYIQKTYNTTQNVAIYSGVFYNAEMKMYSEGKVLSSFGKYRRANYPKFNENSCTYWDYETERQAKDALNDKIADSKRFEFKVIRTGYEY